MDALGRRRPHTSILLGYLLALSTCAIALLPASTAHAQAAPRRSTVSELLDDLSILRQTFEQAHAGLYRYTTKASIDSAFDAIRARLTRPLSELEFYRRLRPLIDLIRDSHSALILSRESQGDIEHARVFPLILRYIGDRPYIEANASRNRDIPLRGEVLSINGHRMTDVTPLLLTGRTTDGFIRNPKFHALHSNFWFFYRALVDTSQSFRIVIRPPGSTGSRVWVAEGVPPESLGRVVFRTRTHSTLALDFREEGRIAVLSVPSFSDSGLGTKLNDAFAAIEKRRSSDLIVDVRDNGGGFDEFNTTLLSYLVDHPYRFYRGFSYVVRDTNAIRFTEHTPEDFISDEDLRGMTSEDVAHQYATHTIPALLDRLSATNPAAGVHQPCSAHGFRGRLYVLVNGGSASSGAEVPSLLHFLGVGTLIGESPNGAFQGVTAGVLLRLRLPHSGLVTLVPLIAYHNAVLPGVFEGQAVPMDFEVPQTVDDAIARKDTALEFTLRLIHARIRPEEED
jgi:hypothetical protein